MVRPLLFVDIDGVLNPFGGQCPDGLVEHWLFEQDDEPVRICSAHGAWLHELAAHFELVWGSGWNADDRAKLALVLNIPRFSGAAPMPEIPFDPSLKTRAIAEWAADRPAAWVDDNMTAEAWAWAAGRTAPTLLIETQPAVGLVRSQVDQLIGWAVAAT